MLLAATTQTNGQRTLVVGLEAENLARLVNDQPILKDLDEIGVAELEGWQLTVLGPEDTIRFLAHFGKNIDDEPS